MTRIEKWKPWGSYFFFFCFFWVLFFNHGKIDIVRIPFFVFILWQLYRKRIGVRFLFDPVTIGVFVFAAIAVASNLLNGLPLNKTIKIINWLFPYLLGKYIIDSESADAEKVILILLTFSAVFSMVGISGYLFGFNEFFGVTLFKSDRYIFTLRGINKAGFYLAVSLLLAGYFIIKKDFSVNKKNLVYYLYFLIIAGGLLLTKERKSIFLVGFFLISLVIVYKQYRMLLVILLVAGTLLLAISTSERFAFDRLGHDEALQGRYNAWESAIGLFKQKPLLGHGFTSFRKAYTQYFKENRETFTFKTFHGYPVAHNINLNALAETGILGCIALNSIFFAFRRFYTYRHAKPLAFIFGAVALFIYLSMQTGNFVHASTRTDLAFLIFGFYIAMAYKDSLKQG
jgi:O-antigen ligase